MVQDLQEMSCNRCFVRLPTFLARSIVLKQGARSAASSESSLRPPDTSSNEEKAPAYWGHRGGFLKGLGYGLLWFGWFLMPCLQLPWYGLSKSSVFAGFERPHFERTWKKPRKS